jgi:hypothetical protein
VDDLQMTKLCGDAMGFREGDTTLFLDGSFAYRIGLSDYDPLHDDAQAMGLLFWLTTYGEAIIQPGEFQFNCDDYRLELRHTIVRPAALRRVIVVTAAMLQMKRAAAPVTSQDNAPAK